METVLKIQNICYTAVLYHVVYVMIHVLIHTSPVHLGHHKDSVQKTQDLCSKLAQIVVKYVAVWHVWIKIQHNAEDGEKLSV